MWKVQESEGGERKYSKNTYKKDIFAERKLLPRKLQKVFVQHQQDITFCIRSQQGQVHLPCEGDGYGAHNQAKDPLEEKGKEIQHYDVGLDWVGGWVKCFCLNPKRRLLDLARGTSSSLHG